MLARGSAGFSTIEALIGMVILSIVLGAVLLVHDTLRGLSSDSSTVGLLDEKGLKAVEAIAADLRWAETGSLLVTSENGSDRLDVRIPVGFDGSGVLWSSTIVYRVERSSFDADENGVLDEGRLVRVQDGRTKSLCDYVVPGGFDVTLDATNLRIELDLAKRDGSTNRRISTHAETSTCVRN